MSYGTNHYRTAVRLMALDLEARQARLDELRREFNKARSKGMTEEARVLGNQKRNASRGVIRCKGRLDRLKLTLEKREEWERMDRVNGVNGKGEERGSAS